MLINWMVLIGLLLTILYLFKSHYKKKQKKNSIDTLTSNFGKQKTKNHYNFDKISQFYQKTDLKRNVFQVLSDQTVRDLNFESLFKFLDRTSSKIGQQFLYYKLRVITNKKSASDINKLSNLFLNDEQLRLNSQLCLLDLNSFNSYSLETIIHDEIESQPPFRKYLIPLTILSFVVIVLGFFNSFFFFFLLPIFAINIVLHFKNKIQVSYYLEAINQLKIAVNIGDKLALEEKIKDFFLDLSFLKKLKKLNFKTHFISLEKQLTNEFAILFWYIIEIIKIQFNFEAIIFYSFIDSITKERKAINDLFCFIGEVDCAISVASVKSDDIKTSEPKFNEDNKIVIGKMIHPLVKNCIPNDISLKDKSMLLTGSNMSGKTTFIRAVAVNGLVAQTLGFAFATSYNAPFFKIHTSINISDDLLNDTSYYLKEVLLIKKFIEASNQKTPNLFILDEIFKGTNTLERIAGGKAILSFLNKYNNFIFVSTHDIELAMLLEKEAYELYHFTEKIITNKLIFDHKLKRGKLTTKNAIKILEIYGYPKIIIEQARQVEQNNLNFLKNEQL